MMFMYHAEFLIDYNLVDSIFSFFGDGFEIFVKTLSPPRETIMATLA